MKTYIARYKSNDGTRLLCIDAETEFSAYRVALVRMQENENNLIIGEK